MPTTSHFNNYHEVVERGVSWTTKTNGGKRVVLTLFEHYWFELVRGQTDAAGTFVYDFIHTTGSNAGTEWNYEITFCGLNGAWQHNITTGKWRSLDRAMRSRCRSRSRSQPRGNARLLALPAPAQEDPELEAEPPSRRIGVWASSDSDSQAVHDGSVSHPSGKGASSSSVHSHNVSGPWEDIHCSTCGQNTGQKKLLTFPGKRDSCTYQIRCYDFSNGRYFESGEKNIRKTVSKMEYKPADWIRDWVWIHRTCCT